MEYTVKHGKRATSRIEWIFDLADQIGTDRPDALKLAIIAPPMVVPAMAGGLPARMVIGLPVCHCVSNY